MAFEAVHASDLLVGYDGEPVCAPVSFSVRPGQALALVGMNGTGKTTVLRAIVGLLAPKGGELLVMGNKVDDRSAAFRRALASVLDQDAYFPALTVAEHLVLTARAHSVQRPGSSARELLEEFDLMDHADYMPAVLSSGQRRRLLLAAALIRPYDVLVLDEPEQRLDIAMRRDIASRLRADTARGKAVVFATHDPELLRAAATKAILLTEDECVAMTPGEAARALETSAAEPLLPDDPQEPA